MMNYAEIEKKMKLYRAGVLPLPKEYVEYHQALAYEAIQKIVHYSTAIRVVHRTYMENDGWMDGMKVLFAIVEMRDGTLQKLKWHDSHQTGHWMQQCASGGWSSMQEVA